MKIVLILSLSLISSNVFSSEYDKLNGCSKQEILWNKIEASKHKKLPEMNSFSMIDIYRFSKQNLTAKVSDNSDIAPKDWIKYIHARGAVAKVKIEPVADHPYTGIFTGADCALLRLSLTYKPKDALLFDKAVAPGLALKVLRDKTHSANISALYSLQGQGFNYNFFENTLSNIVPIGKGIGQKIVHNIFAKYTRYPEQLLLKDLSLYNSEGQRQNNVTPTQLFFVPNKSAPLPFSSDEHDVRKDFLKIPSGTHLYDIYAFKNNGRIDYSKYTLEQLTKEKGVLEGSILIGRIVTTSPFIASQFGDFRLFFKHEAK